MRKRRSDEEVALVRLVVIGGMMEEAKSKSGKSGRSLAVIYSHWRCSVGWE